MLEDKKIPLDYLTQVCKYRQGANCCRYIVYFKDHADFFCVKKLPEQKEKIDAIKDQLVAQADHCTGLPLE